MLLIIKWPLNLMVAKSTKSRLLNPYGYISTNTFYGQFIYIEKITKKIASAIGALKHIRPLITTKTAVQVYQALIQPHFDYCCSVWDNKLQKLQNKAVRVITSSPYDASVSPLLDSLHLDIVSLCRKKIKAKMMLKY